MCDFYQQAANVIDQLIQKKGSIKGLTYSGQSNNTKTSKTTYALVCETLKYKDVVDEIIGMVPELEKEKSNVKYSLMIVMIYELLFSSKQTIKGGGIAKKTIMQYKTQMVSSLARMKIKKRVADSIDLLPEHIRNPITLPRYVRINSLFNGCMESAVQDAINTFVAEGYDKIDKPVQANNIGEKEFYQDVDFPEILVFNANVDLHDHKMLLDGHIILQDKASCMPSYILSPPPGSVVIDSCSAPGNKTSLLSAQMKNKGQIFAIEKDKKRMGTLVKLTTRSQCKNIEAINDSFLNLRHDDPKYKDVEYILCDPSCSGSGIVNRLDYLLPTKYSTDTNENEDIDDIIKDISNSSNSKRQTESTTATTTTSTTDNEKNKKEMKKDKKRKLKEMKAAEKNGKKGNNNKESLAAAAANAEKLKEEQEEKEKKEEEERVQLLADFQLSIIRHAFGFPSIKRVIYSTCSIHQVENEDVVQRALEELNKDKETWRLVNILPHWNHSRGYSIYKNSEYSIRMTPSIDHTIGFFVALFERIDTTVKAKPLPIPISQPKPTKTPTPAPASAPTPSTTSTTTSQQQKPVLFKSEPTKPSNSTKKKLGNNNNNNNNNNKNNTKGESPMKSNKKKIKLSS
ncbi:hypothetical protein CYY_001574 [Polysphondylium violaceum]|uniref:SAM-dependent MTase RsmB/NOP-type domain-containing protein n=1 Tax=Polysphondylium violaceum TaxID=133409 RepID=A0A8J4Q2W0_9MYCE|nr:hypothetical protein CYY_001574 [Polysphondylium violaceum]